MNGAKTYDLTALSKSVSLQEAGQIREHAYVFEPILKWLEQRAKDLQTVEDLHGGFRDDCPNHLHVRALKGARNDCQDIIAELRDVLKNKNQPTGD